MSLPSALVRRRHLYFGQVQGVGFRATAAAIARRHAVGGYVRNLEDGSVELEAEGTEDEVRAFLRGVASAMGERIARTTAEELPPTGRAGGFSIRGG